MGVQTNFFDSCSTESEDKKTTRDLCVKMLNNLSFIVSILNYDISILRRSKPLSDEYDVLTSIREKRSAQAKYIAFLGDVSRYEVPESLIGKESRESIDAPSIIEVVKRVDKVVLNLIKQLQSQVLLSDIDNIIINKVYKLI